MNRKERYTQGIMVEVLDATKKAYEKKFKTIGNQPEDIVRDYALTMCEIAKVIAQFRRRK